MGGAGSGRHADPVKKLMAINNPIGNYNELEPIILPDYSGVAEHLVTTTTVFSFSVSGWDMVGGTGNDLSLKYDSIGIGGYDLDIVNGETLYIRSSDSSASLNINLGVSFTGTGTTTFFTDSYFLDDKLKIYNPAATQNYTFSSSAISAGRVITLPLMTTDGNMVIDSFANTFTAAQTMNAGTNSTYGLTLGGTSTGSALNWINFKDGSTNYGGVIETLGLFGFVGNNGSAFFGLSDASAYTLLTSGGNYGIACTNLGFYGVTAVARPSAYTQTYSTATKTHSNLTSATLTDSTGGTANTTCVAISGTGDDANINNNMADMIAQINALRVDLENAKQVINSIIDDDQALGLKQ